VDFPGVSTGHGGQPHHRVLVDPHQATGLADATIFLEVVQDGDGFVRGELAMEQGDPLALGEPLLTGAAGQHPPLTVRAITEANPQVVQAAAAVIGTGGVLAAEDFQVVHGSLVLPSDPKKGPRSCIYPIKQLQVRQRWPDTTESSGRPKNLADGRPQAIFCRFFAGNLHRPPTGGRANCTMAYMSGTKPALGKAATSGRRRATNARSAASTRAKSSRFGQVVEK
jgi:hypothetical protein